MVGNSVGGRKRAGAAGALGDEDLGPLLNIWDDDKVHKREIQGPDGKYQKDWTCDWCPSLSSGKRPDAFKGWNATKALLHVCKWPGKGVRACRGTITSARLSRYRTLLQSNHNKKEDRRDRQHQHMEEIVQMEVNFYSFWFALFFSLFVIQLPSALISHHSFSALCISLHLGKYYSLPFSH